MKEKIVRKKKSQGKKWGEIRRVLNVETEKMSQVFLWDKKILLARTKDCKDFFSY